MLHLEIEVQKLKQALAAERRMRSLQSDAIRSLYNQVQKMEGGPPASGTSQPPPIMEPHACSCSEKVDALRTAMEREMLELRRTVEELRGGGAQRPGSLNLSRDVSGYAGEMASKIVRGVE